MQSAANAMCFSPQTGNTIARLFLIDIGCCAEGYCSAAFAVASVGMAQSAPIVIGATGGSGTRVLARIAKLAGYNLGNNVNSAEDALEFYSFFDIWVDRFFSAQHQGKTLTSWESARLMENFYAALARHIPEAERRGMLWGWKAPRSIYLLPFLHGECPRGGFRRIPNAAKLLTRAFRGSLPRTARDCNENREFSGSEDRHRNDRAK